MFASFITVVSALAASVAALPTAVQSREVYATWKATNFQEGCSPVSSKHAFISRFPADNIIGWLHRELQHHRARGLRQGRPGLQRRLPPHLHPAGMARVRHHWRGSCRLICGVYVDGS